MSIKFALPGLYENFTINKIFIEYINQHPQIINENCCIGAVYGNFQYCIWDGGRIFSSYTHTTIEEIEEIKKFYEKYNIPLRFVFTNTKITEQDCLDRFCNLVLELCQNKNNEIVVNSEILKNYIQKQYPDYKLISSTTKCLLNTTDIIQELNNNDFELICLDYNLNHNLNLLKSLDSNQKKKTEFLINAICPPGCPSRKLHYDLNSYCSLNYGKNYPMIPCELKENPLFEGAKCKKTHLTLLDIKEYYDLGFSNFKIEGRTFPAIGHLANCIYYLIKPEYQLSVFQDLADYFIIN